MTYDYTRFREPLPPPVPTSERPNRPKNGKVAKTQSLYVNDANADDDDYEQFVDTYSIPADTSAPLSPSFHGNAAKLAKQKSVPPPDPRANRGGPSSSGMPYLADTPPGRPPPVPDRKSKVSLSESSGTRPLPLPPPASRPPAPLPVPSQPSPRYVISSSAPSGADFREEFYEDFDFGSSSEKKPEACSGDGMSLLEFFNQFKDQFPKSFEVTLGFSCQGDETSISEGEKFVAHFVKRTKIITIRDENNELFSIPFNSALEFGLLHDPHNNPKEAQNGFTFKTAGDLMISRILPRAVRARKAFRGISPESSVEQNELLLLKEVVHKEGERRYVKCIQSSTGKEKHLHEDCAGQFSTNPYDIRLLLPDILKHFQLPLKAVLYIGSDIDEDLPMSLVTSVVEIVQQRTEETLVASTILDDNVEERSPLYTNTMDEDVPSNQVNEIPLKFDINVSPIPVTPLTREKMLAETKKLFEDFNAQNVYPYLMNSSLTQLALMKIIRKDTPNVGVELIPSRNIMRMREREKLHSASSSADSVETAFLSKKVLSLESKSQELHDKLGQVAADGKKFNAISKMVSALQEENSQLCTQFQMLAKEVTEMKSLLTAIQSKVDSPQRSVAGLADSCEGNRLFLATLDAHQVAGLLRTMNLSQYTQRFMDEDITGALLCDLQDDILEDDLGVKQKFHRLKLMKLISGHYSAEKILKGDKAYVEMYRS